MKLLRPQTLTLALLALVLGSTSTAFAQFVLDQREVIDFDRPEAWAMKYFAAVSTPTGVGVPGDTTPGTVLLQLEGGWVPSLSEEERTVGFFGTKTEDLNRTSVFVRPRLVVGLPRSISLALAWVPPVDLDGVEANLFSLSLGAPIYRRGNWRLALEGFGQIGSIEGDLTCDRDSVAAGDDPVRNAFGCNKPSNDEQEIDTFGLELGWAWRAPTSRWEPHAGLLVTHMDLDLQIRAEYRDIVDRSQLVTDGTTYALAGGLSYHAGDRWRLAGEVFYSPLEVVRPPRASSRNDGLLNVRALVSYRIRGGDRS